MYRVRLEDLDKFMDRLGKAADRAIRDTMIRAAQYGRAQAQVTSKRKKLRASGTYDDNFVVIVAEGTGDTVAQLGNAARHAYFVEEGRRPGKRPPLNPILEWIRLKGLIKTPRKPKFGPRQRQRPKFGPKERPKHGPRQRKPKRKTTRKKKITALQLAFLIQRKIGKHGTEGHHVFATVVPKMQEFALKQVEKQIRKAMRGLGT